MCDALARRGPDSYGSWLDPARGVALGHRRLSIVDLSETGAQPMTSPSGRYVVTFNGEIYNYRELRSELSELGCVFEGSSDTEVMLHGFDTWGIPGSLDRMIGMFAFALWDREKSILTLARDRIGEKPLFYGFLGPTFAFASTVTALRELPEFDRPVSRDVIAAFLQTNYIPAPYSIFEGILSLKPGHYLELSTDATQWGRLPEPTCYWSMREAATKGARDPFRGSPEEAVDMLAAKLKEAAALQMVADVPVGAFLSGGIDSSAVVAAMQQCTSRPVRTFTVGFHDQAYDEAPYARLVAKHLGTSHTEIYLRPEEALDLIPRLPQYYDEPFGDASQVPTCLVSQLARRHVTVSLSGDGGDEMFCGYNRHVRLFALQRRISLLPHGVRIALASILRSVPTSLMDGVLRQRRVGLLGDQVQKLASVLPMQGLDEMYRELCIFWSESAGVVLGAKPLPTEFNRPETWPSELSPMQRLLWIESVTSLPDDMLTKVDRGSMAFSLEGRMPLLDHRLVEFAWSLPDDLKVRRGVSKWVLRQVLYRSVPKRLIDRPKAGFGIPIDEWLRGPLRDWAEHLLDEHRLREQGLLDVQIVRKCWSEHVSGERKWQGKLWGILMLESWLEHNCLA